MAAARRPAPKTKKAPPRRAKRSRRWPARVLRLFQVAALLLVPAGLYVAYVYSEVSTLVEQRRAAMSSSIYSAPHRITSGQSLAGSRLLERLASLSYSLVANVDGPGQYTRSASDLTIHLRGFTYRTIEHAPMLVRIRLDKGVIASVVDENVVETDQAMVEPETIGRLIPGAPAERVESSLAEQRPYLVEGLLATEDQYFYWHPGFNPVRILYAAVEDLRAGRLAQGASTLTQQLARTFLERRERSFERKILELAFAIVLELRLTKDQILERYINDVSMGAYGGMPIHGMPQAARTFFNKDLSQVTPAEAATLIGMVQAPTLYDPRRHTEASQRRRDVVLGAMHRQGVIDDETYASAVASPIALSKPPGLRRAPYFTDFVLSQLRTLPGVGAHLEGLEDLAGLRVYTTLDTEIQAKAATATTSNLEKLEKSYRGLRRTAKDAKLQSSAVVLDAATGAVLAMVGGRSYAETQFNRAATALRQPGSAFKPVLYLAALDPGRSPVKPALTLASLLPDEPMTFGGWSPENHERSYRIQVTAATAIADSLNVPAAYVGSRVGPELIVRTAHDLGIPQDLQAMLPIAIGAEETTLLDLVSAYQVFANAGTRAPSYAIESIVDAKGREIYRHEPAALRTVRPDVAYVVTGALKMVMQSGTGASAKALGLDIATAGKTGTTQDYRDAYFVGYSPDLVCGVWVGFDAPQSMGLTGAQAALPPWVEILKGSASAGEDFPVPPGIEMVRIDPQSGGIATASCPSRASLPFLAGTGPVDPCPLHAGGGWETAGLSDRNWGGWRSTTRLAAAKPSRAEPARPSERVNVFRKMGKFFGSLFQR
jgi:penicillin-binding protein 1B